MAMNGEYLRPVMTWVDSEQEARISYVAPGSVGFFMEKNNPKFYIKDSNTNLLRVFEFKEVTPAPEAPSTPYVTQDEFHKAIEDLKYYISDAVKPRYKNNYNKEKENHG